MNNDEKIKQEIEGWFIRFATSFIYDRGKQIPGHPAVLYKDKRDFFLAEGLVEYINDQLVYTIKAEQLYRFYTL
jgi:hypothetical protein